MVVDGDVSGEIQSLVLFDVLLLDVLLEVQVIGFQVLGYSMLLRLAAWEFSPLFRIVQTASPGVLRMLSSRSMVLQIVSF